MLQSRPPVTIAHVRAALRRPLPGLPAQLRMSPQPRPGSERILEAGLDCRHAGVLVLLYPCPEPVGAGQELCLVLTRRTESLASHQGQISFPGGSMEDGETPEAAALREAREELAVQAAGLEILGRLSPLYIPPSGFCIYPVVAYAPRRPAFVPEAAEVAEVIEEPLWHLLDGGTCRAETRLLRGQLVQVPYYAVGPHKVWGATAMALCEFLALLGEAVAEGGERP